MSPRTSNIFDPIQKELDQKVFNNITPRPRIIKFITDEMQKVLTPLLGFDPLEFMDLYLTGSLTTYQYGPTSDCDISVFIQWDLWPTGEAPNMIRRSMIPIIMDKLDGTLLPGTQHPIQHFLVPPGTRPEDLYKPGLRSAWSFRDKRWLVPPEKDRVHDISVELPVLYHRAEMMADKMEELLAVNPIYAKEFWHQIHRKRQKDQQAGLGDFSEGNIVYKYLLHNGYFDRIRDELGEKIAKVAAPKWLPNLKPKAPSGMQWVGDPKKSPFKPTVIPGRDTAAFQLGRATAVMAHDPERRAEAQQIYEAWSVNPQFVDGWNMAYEWAGHPQMPPETIERYRQEFDQLRQALGKVAADEFIPPIGSIWTMSNPMAGAMPSTKGQPKRQTIEVIDNDDDDIWYRDLDSKEEHVMDVVTWNNLMHRQIIWQRDQQWQIQQSPEQAAEWWPDTLPENWSKVASHQIMYHLAPPAARESILQHGLDATQAAFNWRDDYPWERMPDQQREVVAPDGQYLWADLKEAEYQYEMGIYDEQPLDLWEVNVEGLDVHPDPWRPASQMTMYDTAYYTPDPIQPERLKLLEPAERISKVADDLSWVDKSTPYGTPDGGFIGGPDHPGDDPMKMPKPMDQEVSPQGKLKVIYDFDKDQIILGDIKMSEQFPPGQIIGDYDHQDVYLNDHATAWFNPGYFKRLWQHSFPKRQIRHVILDKGNGQHEVVHHHQGSAILEANEEDHRQEASHEEDRPEAPEALQEAQEHVAMGEKYAWPDWDDVDFLSHEAVENHQGYRDPDAVMGAVGNTQMAYQYGQHNDIFDTAADLLYKIQRQQAVVDGNKRTGAAVALHFLEENGVDTTPLVDRYEELATMINSLDRGSTPQQLAEFFRAILKQ